MSITRGFGSVRFTEPIAHVSYGKATILLRGNLDVIRFPAVFRWRRRLRTLRRRRQRRYGYRLLLLVNRIRDKHPRDGVFLAAELGKVNLPYIFDTGRREEDLHRIRLRAFAGAVVGHDRARPKRVREELRIDVSVARCNQ